VLSPAVLYATISHSSAALRALVRDVAVAAARASQLGGLPPTLNSFGSASDDDVEGFVMVGGAHTPPKGQLAGGNGGSGLEAAVHGLESWARLYDAQQQQAPYLASPLGPSSVTTASQVLKYGLPSATGATGSVNGQPLTFRQQWHAGTKGVPGHGG
jgi:hypothetical protein